MRTLTHLTILAIGLAIFALGCTLISQPAKADVTCITLDTGLTYCW